MLLSQSQARTHTKLQTVGETMAGEQRCRGAEEQRKILPTTYHLPPTIPPLATRHSPLISTACLELSSLPLHQQITEFGDRALGLGYKQLQILPLFLLPGVHVMEDIPAEVALAQQALGQKLKLDLRPHLGSHSGLIRLLANQLAKTKAEAWILLTHGSSRAGAKQPVEAIAQQLGAVSAYWAVAPSLASRVQELAIAGHQRIGILPYFLFAGGITDAIAQVVAQLQEQYPTVSFYLAEPLGASQELADLIWDLVRK